MAKKKVAGSAKDPPGPQTLKDGAPALSARKPTGRRVECWISVLAALGMLILGWFKRLRPRAVPS